MWNQVGLYYHWPFINLLPEGHERIFILGSSSFMTFSKSWLNHGNCQTLFGWKLAQQPNQWQKGQQVKLYIVSTNTSKKAIQGKYTKWSNYATDCHRKYLQVLSRLLGALFNLPSGDILWMIATDLSKLWQTLQDPALLLRLHCKKWSAWIIHTKLIGCNSQ